jgi:short-subunit dehydrogenase
MMEPRAVAEAGFHAMMKGKRVIIPGFMNKFGAFMAKRLPTAIPAKIAGKVMGGPD